MRFKMTTKASPPIIKIKKELPNDEIKDFAETAMNELLGWYGYENVDRMDLPKGSRSLNRNRINNTNGIRPRSITPERNSSRESSKSPMPLKIAENLDLDCAWCRRTTSQTSENFGTQDGPKYCSESCFAQSRRASFKRAKTCDWCRHVRHAVSYVDFQDGASQLQFCSDKCLNQYKMQIFCKETQAHLDMNPHLKETGKGSCGNLITPELWLKNCRSRSNSPKSDEHSRSSTPLQKLQLATAAQPSVPVSPPMIQLPIQKPLISVAPPSKLMPRLNQMTHHQNKTIISNKTRRRRPGRLASSSSLNQHNSSNNLNGNRTPNISPPMQTNVISTKPCTVTSAQDLRINVQQKPNENSLNLNLNQHPKFHHPFLSPTQQQQHQVSPQPATAPSNIFQIRPPHLGGHLSPRFIPPSQQQQQQQAQQQHPLPTASSQIPFTFQSEPPRLPPFGPAPPPVTILVPYPIVIPLPIPIPIPIPIADFLHAAQKHLNINNNNIVEKNFNSKIINIEKVDNQSSDEPLDCTKSKELVDIPIDYDDDIEEHDINDYEMDHDNNIIENDDHHHSDENYNDNNLLNNNNNNNDKFSIKITKSSSPSPLLNDSSNENSKNSEQKLPKFKITRLNSKRIITPSPASETPPPSSPIVTTSSVTISTSSSSTVPPEISTVKSNLSITTTIPSSSITKTPLTSPTSKEFESSRPLRKRKRIMDCENHK